MRETQACSGAKGFLQGELLLVAEEVVQKVGFPEGNLFAERTVSQGCPGSPGCGALIPAKLQAAQGPKQSRQSVPVLLPPQAVLEQRCVEHRHSDAVVLLSQMVGVGRAESVCCQEPVLEPFGSNPAIEKRIKIGVLGLFQKTAQRASVLVVLKGLQNSVVINMGHSSD